jgi:hypothetical protein
MAQTSGTYCSTPGELRCSASGTQVLKCNSASVGTFWGVSDTCAIGCKNAICLSTVSNLSYSNVNCNSATISWFGGEGAASKFYYYYINGSDAIRNGEAYTTTATSVNLTGLTPGAKIQWGVQGYNAAGLGPMGFGTSFTTPYCPASAPITSSDTCSPQANQSCIPRIEGPCTSLGSNYVTGSGNCGNTTLICCKKNTCTAVNGVWSACSCSGTRTCTNPAPSCGGTTCSGSSSCTIPTSCGGGTLPPGGTVPTAPTLGTATCTGTTATLNWTDGTGATTINAYYCDQTKAGSAACTPDQPSLPTAQHFLLISGGGNKSPLTVPNLVANDHYKWLVAGYNATGHTNSAIGDFTCGNGTTVGGASVKFNIGLDVIGTTGTHKNATLTNPTTDPKTKSRVLKVSIKDSTDKEVLAKDGTLTFNAATGRYDGVLDLGVTLPTGITSGTAYRFKVGTPGYKSSALPEAETITTGQVTTTNPPSPVNLTAGDADGNGDLGVGDFTVILDCQGKDPSTVTTCKLADVDDNGTIDQFDYNLYLEEYQFNLGN